MNILRNALLGLLAVSAVACAANTSDEAEGDADSAIKNGSALSGLPVGSYFQVGDSLAAGSLFEVRLFKTDADGHNCAVTSVVSNDVYAGPGPYPRSRLYTANIGDTIDGVNHYQADDPGDYLAGTVTPILDPEAVGTCKQTGEGQFEITAIFNVYEPEETPDPVTFSVAYKINGDNTVTFTPVDGELPVSWDDVAGTKMARGAVHECVNPRIESSCYANGLTCSESTTPVKVNGANVYQGICK